MSLKVTRTALGAALATALLGAATPVLATDVVFNTTFGLMEVELYDEQTPQTVANFLNYVRDGRYDDSLIHRSVPEFVIQGGGFFLTEDETITDILTDPPVQNEPGISNTRGTIAMAKVGGDPDSATSQFYFNVFDNSENLDNQNGGFTVFGEIKDDDLFVMDALSEVQTWRFNAPFDAIPLLNYDGTTPVTPDNLVLLSVTELTDFTLNAGLNDAWFDPDTDGQGFFVTVFPDSNQLFMSWFTFDAERPADDVTAFLGDAGHRWYTAIGPIEGNRADLTVSLTEGGEFDASTPSPMTATAGRIEVIFADCSLAELFYSLPESGESGSIRLTRVVPDNISLCEALAEG